MHKLMMSEESCYKKDQQGFSSVTCSSIFPLAGLICLQNPSFSDINQDEQNLVVFFFVTLVVLQDFPGFSALFVVLFL